MRNRIDGALRVKSELIRKVRHRQGVNSNEEGKEIGAATSDVRFTPRHPRIFAFADRVSIGSSTNHRSSFNKEVSWLRPDNKSQVTVGIRRHSTVLLTFLVGQCPTRTRRAKMSRASHRTVNQTSIPAESRQEVDITYHITRR